ncbi:LETM1-like protein-domain-containing protein [Entophlyctis helioformis]|nr:LETM1-like protein-domain-containing protein [Entophlyctis helioformis]
MLLRQVKVSRDDFRKVIPFFVILLIVPETLPFLILSGANIIPSTCILPDQLTAKRVKLNKTRHSMTLATTESIQRGQVFSIDSLRSTETVRHLAAYQPQYFQLHSMSRAQLRQFSRFMGFSSWQPTFMLRSRLARHFAFVRSDDAMLSVAPGLAELSLEELQEACENRGMSCVNLDRDALAANLQAWLDLHTTTDPPIPEGLMMLWTMVHGKAAAATEPLATASDAPLPSPTSTPA